MLGFEQLLKVWFSDSGTRTGALASIAATRRWADPAALTDIAHRAQW